MRINKTLGILVIGLLAAGTVWAQMGDDDGWQPKRREHKGFQGRGGEGRGGGLGGGRFGQDREGRGPGNRQGMGGQGGQRKPPMEMMIGKLIQNPEAAEKLGLTEEQISKIKNGTEEIRTGMQELTEKMRSAAEEQVKLLQGDTIDEAALMAAVEKTGAIRTEIAKLKIRGLILVKTTLTPEQVQKIKQFIHHRRQQMNERRGRGPRDGEGGGDGEGDGNRPRFRRDKGWGRDKGHGDGAIRGGWRDRERAKDGDAEGDDAGEL